jgi:hypothetical protein
MRTKYTSQWQAATDRVNANKGRKLLPRLLPKHTLTAAGIPQVKLLDHIPLETKEIAPYQCVSCESIFKRLSGLVIHNRYHRDKGACPTDKTLRDLNLEQITHTANGKTYTVWHLIPPVAPTGIKDELLVQLDALAFPNFNQSKE